MSVMQFQLTTKDRERFESHVYRIPGGCHIWLARCDRLGYGRFRVHRDNGEPAIALAHRVAWRLSGRVITPEKPCILHNCPGGDWPGCVNEDHLWDGTNADNSWDMSVKGRAAKSESGLPFGADLRSNGRFRSRARVNGKVLNFGTYDTAGEASAVAVEIKRRWLAEVAP